MVRAMSQDYFANNGEMETVNYSGNKFLGKLTFGLWDKIGIPRPLSEMDSKLIARIINNYIKLQTKDRIMFRDAIQRQLHEIGYKLEEEDTIIWLKELANFFEKSGGLMSEEEWCEREKLKESE